MTPLSARVVKDTLSLARSIAQPVAVVILNWNKADLTLACLRSVVESLSPPSHIVVLDNGSTDTSLAEISSGLDAIITARQDADGSEFVAPRITLLRSTDNLGFSGGCNEAIENALARGAAYVLLLNNDVVVRRDALECAKTVASEADAAIVGCTIFDGSGGRLLFAGSRWPIHLFASLPQALKPERYWDSSEAQGSAVLLRRDFLEERITKSGYVFDPAFFMYCEDADLCLFAAQEGYKCVIARDAVAYHGVAQSSGGELSPRSLYYLTRNRIRLARRWLNQPVRAVFHLYFIPSRLLIALTRPQQWHSGATHAVVRGLIDGYAGVSGKWVLH